MRWNVKREIFPFVIIALFVILSIYFYPILQERIPSHFNLNGMPDKYSPKSHVVWLNLGLAAFIYLLLTFIPFLDPFWKRIQNKYNVFLMFRDFALLFFLFFYLLELFSAKEGRFARSVYGVGFGLLFIFLGNYLPKLPRNFFFGIRSPWTLASEIVWKKTHILSGWLFVLAGIMIIILSLLKVNLFFSLIVILVPVILYSSIIYPLYLYKKLQKAENNKVPQL